MPSKSKFPHPTPEMMQHWVGYPMLFVHDRTNETICQACAHKMAANPEQLTDLCENYVCDIYYEGAPLTCDSCNREIESAYGDPEED